MTGERSPLMDPQARGCFVGLTLEHQQGHLARAIMEGVAFALRHILETMALLEVRVARLLAVGNGLASSIWRQIVADVLACPLYLPAGQEHAALGAAVLAGMGAGLYRGYLDARRVIPGPIETTEPTASGMAFYQEHYERFRAVYPALRSTLHELSGVSWQAL